MEILTAGEDRFLLVFVRKNCRVETFYCAWDLERGGEKDGKGMEDSVEIHRKLSTDR